MSRPHNSPSQDDNRRVRVFLSSTFRDMVEERDELMTHAWPGLRRLCREHDVELIEVDMRWGISEEQSTRKETLKLCLDEIRACRPYFIGLLGERYGWVPGYEAFTADLAEEQPWLKDLHDRSVTELEILHGVLNEPEIASRAFFYFRAPAYAKTRGVAFVSDDAESAAKQAALKKLVRATCEAKGILLREGYATPRELSALVLRDLAAAIEADFPSAEIPDLLTREARDHEAFAETRRRTYIGRTDYFDTLDRHAAAAGGPLVLLGDSGGGKSALIANWLAHWRAAHPTDFVFQHYIGGTPDNAEHGRLLSRLVAEIKRWTNDPEELPRSRDDLLKTVQVWLVKARIKAERDGVRCLVVLDALNQIEDQDSARLLGWLPSHPLQGALRLIVSTLPGETLDALNKRGWASLRVEPLTPDECRQMIAEYLARFGKKLDKARLDRLADAPAASNPLYLKILLDELRVTGTHGGLDERLSNYLAAPDIPALLGKVLARYQGDYERDRPGLVVEALSLIWAARRGLTESELLRLLRPAHLKQLPIATWAPLRAALEDGLIDRGGILDFAHEFLRTTVEIAFVGDDNGRLALWRRLADDFEAQPVSARSCDELPWLLCKANDRDRLRACLLDIDRFVLLHRPDQELMRYWVWLGESQAMGPFYLDSFARWAHVPHRATTDVCVVGNELAGFLFRAALYVEAEPLMRGSLQLMERTLPPGHPNVATALDNLAVLLGVTNRPQEAEPLMRRSLAAAEQARGPDDPAVAVHLENLGRFLRERNRNDEAEVMQKRAHAICVQSFGTEHPRVSRSLDALSALFLATNRLAEAEPLMRQALAINERNYDSTHPEIGSSLNNLAQVLREMSRFAEAEPLMRRAVHIAEHSYGFEHPEVADCLHNLAMLVQETNRLAEAEPLIRRAIAIWEQRLGPVHPKVAVGLSGLASQFQSTGRLAEAEPLLRRALAIWEASLGEDHPTVAVALNMLADLLAAKNHLPEAELLMRRSIVIDEKALGNDHPNVGRHVGNLASLLYTTNRLGEAEPLMVHVVKIFEKSLGQDHPSVATAVNNLAQLLKATNRVAEAEPLIRRALAIDERTFGPDHPRVAVCLNNLAQLLGSTNRWPEAEPLMRRALAIDEQCFGDCHPDVATDLSNLGRFLHLTNRVVEAEPLMRRALAIDEHILGKDHPNVAIRLNNLAQLLQDRNCLVEAEPLMRRALAIWEQSFGQDHPNVASALNNLAQLLHVTNRLAEAEPLMRRHLQILVTFARATGGRHPDLQGAIRYYATILHAMGRTADEIVATLREIAPEFFRSA